MKPIVEIRWLHIRISNLMYQSSSHYTCGCSNFTQKVEKDCNNAVSVRLWRVVVCTHLHITAEKWTTGPRLKSVFCERPSTFSIVIIIIFQQSLCTAICSSMRWSTCSLPSAGWTTSWWGSCHFAARSDCGTPTRYKSTHTQQSHCYRAFLLSVHFYLFGSAWGRRIAIFSCNDIHDCFRSGCFCNSCHWIPANPDDMMQHDTDISFNNGV